MNLQQLETFVRVAEHGSFSKASRISGTAQPALSRHVRALESELRETLLERNGRGVTLTDAGRRLLEHAQAILQRVAEAKEDLTAQRDAPLGQVVVAMPPTLARLHTLPLIEAFRNEAPRARLAVMEGFSVHISEWLVSGRTDLGIVYNPEPLPGLEIEPLRDERLSLISAASAALPQRVGWAELSRLPLVMPQRGHIFRKLLESAAALAGVRLDVRWEVSSVPAILDLVVAGIGHAALGHDAIRGFGRPKRLRVTPLPRANLRSTLCLVTPAHKRATPLTRTTSALLRRVLSAPRPSARTA